MFVFLAWIMFALGVGAWANAWNRSFIGFTILSLIISPLLGGLALIISGANKKVCPKCAEKVNPEAQVCKHCGHTFETSKEFNPYK